MACERCDRRARRRIDRLRADVERLSQIADVFADEADSASFLANRVLVHLERFCPTFYDDLFDDDERDAFDEVAPFGTDEDDAG